MPKSNLALISDDPFDDSQLQLALMAPITACKNKHRDQMMPSQTRFVVGVVVVAAALFAPPAVRHVNNSSLFQGQSSNLQTFSPGAKYPNVPSNQSKWIPVPKQVFPESSTFFRGFPSMASQPTPPLKKKHRHKYKGFVRSYILRSIKGNQRLMSPDHKAGHFLGRLRQGRVD